MKCNHCGFDILDDFPFCPFCKMALKQETELARVERERRFRKKDRYQNIAVEESFGAYPEIKEQYRRRKRVLAVTLFFVIMVESILIMVNAFTYERYTYPWSALIGGVLFFLFLGLWNVFRQGVGHIAKIYMQMGLFLLLFVFLDVILEKQGVLLGYGIPILVDIFLGVVLFCMLVNRKNYQTYVILLFFLLVFSGVLLILVIAGVLKNEKLISTSFLAAFLFFLGTVMLGGRKVRQELNRKFHV